MFIAATTILGFLLSQKLKNRSLFIVSFLDFLCNLQANIKYSGEDIFSLIEKSATNKYLEMFNCSKEENFNEYWKYSIANIPQAYGLAKEDYSLLKDFGIVLGVTDVDGQVSHIELYKNLFENQLKKAEVEYKTKSKLYKMIGFFSGCAIALMII